MLNELVNASSLHPLQIEILLSLRHHRFRSFSQLQPIDITSDLLTYHLKQLQLKKLVSKEAKGYSLTKKGKKISLEFHPLKHHKLVHQRNSVLLALRDGENFLFQERLVEPFLGIHELPTSKIPYGLQIKAYAETMMEKETGLTGKLVFKGINHKIELLDRRLYDDKLYYVFECLKTSGTLIKKTSEFSNTWLSLSELDGVKTHKDLANTLRILNQEELLTELHVNLEEY